MIATIEVTFIKYEPTSGSTQLERLNPELFTTMPFEATNEEINIILKKLNELFHPYIREGMMLTAKGEGGRVIG